MITHKKIYRWPYSRFTFSEGKNQDNTYKWGDGFYVSKRGVFCRIYHDGGFKDRRPSTSFDVQYKGYSYTKTYGCSFSYHGMQMIAAKMIKDIEKGKFKTD